MTTEYKPGQKIKDRIELEGDDMNSAYPKVVN